MMRIIDPPDPFVKLPALAERLGVKPVAPDHPPGSVFLCTKDGRSYDLFDLINAALDFVATRNNP